jgi:hypothetical protein
MPNRNPFDALNQNREAYKRGVETNHRLRDAWSNARAMDAMNRAREEQAREAYSQRVGAAAYREPLDSRQVAADFDGWIETYNVYMDVLSTGEDLDGEEMVEVAFRVVPGNDDTGNLESDAVIAGLDLVDLINLRDALTLEIDNYALSALEAQASGL